MRGGPIRGSAGLSAGAVEAAIAPARTTWAAAGGAAPDITCVDPFGMFTEADPDLGTGATQDSSWQEIGKECFGHFRIILGTDSTPGQGFYVITGWPALPVLSDGNARFIGEGVVVDASDGYFSLPVQCLVDPQIDPTRPFVIAPAYWNAGTFTKAASPIVSHNHPISFDDGDIINVSFRFERA